MEGPWLNTVGPERTGGGSDFGTQPANRVLASPASSAGALAPRSLTPADLGTSPSSSKVLFGDGTWRAEKLPNSEQGYFTLGASFSNADASNYLVLGKGDFTLVMRLAAQDYTPGASMGLASKCDAGAFLGWQWRILTNGALQLAIGNGSNFSSYTYTSSVPIPVQDGFACELAVSCDRDGQASFWVNGQPLGSSVPMLASAGQSVSCGGPLKVGADLLGAFRGRLHGAWIYNYALSRSEIEWHFHLGRRALEVQGSCTNLLSDASSFESASWTRNSLVVAPDATADPDGGYAADALAASPGTAAHYVARNGMISPLGARRRVAVRLKRIAGGAQYVVFGETQDSVFHLVTVDLAAGQISHSSAVDASGVENLGSGWMLAWFEYTAQTTLSSRLEMAISTVATNASTRPSFAATGSESFYAYKMELLPLGALLALEPEGAQPVPSQWLDTSASGLHVVPSSNTLWNVRTVRRGQVRGRTSTNGNQLLCSSACLPSGGRISAIVAQAASGSPNVSLGSSSGGTQICPALTLAAGRNELAPSSRYSSSGSIWVNSTTTDVIDWTFLYEVVD